MDSVDKAPDDNVIIFSKSFTIGEKFIIYYDAYGRWVERYVYIAYPYLNGVCEERREESDYENIFNTSISNWTKVLWRHDLDGDYKICSSDARNINGDPKLKWSNTYSIKNEKGDTYTVHESEIIITD